MLATLLPNILRVGYFVKTARHLVWCSWLSNESEHHDKIYRRASGLQIEDWSNAWIRYVILKALALESATMNSRDLSSCHGQRCWRMKPWRPDWVLPQSMTTRTSGIIFFAPCVLHIMCQKRSYWEDRFVKPDTAFQDRTSHQLWNWAGSVMVW